MIKVWSWRGAIQQSDLQSITKLVLFNLSVYMNEHGGGCYPTIERQAKDTGLTERSIITHLQKAVKAGFISIFKTKLQGNKFTNNNYKACYPAGIVMGEPNSCAEPLKGESGASMGESDDIQRVNDVHANTPVNTSINNTPFYNYVQPLGVSEQLWVDFLLHRKKIKKEVDGYYINYLIPEITKSGKSATEILTMVLVNKWQGYKYKPEFDKPTESKKITSNNILAGL